MKLIEVVKFITITSCNTNNCYHEGKETSLRIKVFGFEWEILNYRTGTVAFHKDNEAQKY